MRHFAKLSIVFLILGISVSFWSCKNTSQKEKEEETVEVKQYDLKDFFKNPEKSSFKLSPEGTYISYLAPYENRMNIFVQKRGEGEALRLTNEKKRDLSGYFWATDDRILFIKDSGGDENFKLYGVNADGSNLIALTDYDGVKVRVVDVLRDLPEYVIIAMNKRNPRFFDPYRLNIETGELEMLYENPGNIEGWVTDHDGVIRMATVTDGVNSSLLYRETGDDEFEEIMTTNFKETMSPLFFTFDNKNIYVATNIGRDKSEIVLYDLEKREETKPIFKHDEVDVYNLGYSKKRKVLTYVSYYTDKRYLKFFDDEFKSYYDMLKKEFPEQEVGISSMTRDEDKFIAVVYSDKSRGGYYYFEPATETIELIHEVSPWIDPADMAEMKPITYESRDGLTINGYLTLPKGKEAKDLPVVIHPHGGPWARDRWGYNPVVQFLANRGYAVLQMNFRGSTGYGRSFKEASFGEWGLKMQDDISDGVNWLIEEGIADPDKVAIYGASYGGYATLAGLTFTPELYACGIDYVGVSNLFTFMETMPPYWESYRDMMYEMVGDPSDEKDSIRLYNTSPVFHADKIQAPLFIAQGANDPRVKKSESDQMVKAMQERGVEVKYMVKDNEGHGFRNEENRFDFFAEMETFLAKHLGDAESIEAEH